MKPTIILIALLLTITIRPCYAIQVTKNSCINPMSFAIKHNCSLFSDYGHGIGKYTCEYYAPNLKTYFLTTDCKGNVVKSKIEKDNLALIIWLLIVFLSLCVILVICIARTDKSTHYNF